MPRSVKKGPFVDQHLREEDRGRAEGGEPEQAGHHDLVAPLDDHPRHGRAHVRRPQRPQVHPGVRHRATWSATSSASSRRRVRSTATPASGRRASHAGTRTRSWHLDVAPQDAGRREPRPRQDGRGGRRPARPACRRRPRASSPRRSSRAAANAEDKSGAMRRSTTCASTRSPSTAAPIAKRWMPRSMGRANRINHTHEPPHGRRHGREVRTSHGSENTSDRLPPRHHQDVVVAVVRGEELRQVAARGPEAQGASSRRSSTTPASSYIEIERAANKAKINIYTARPGHRHRQARRGRRDAQEGSPGADRERGLPQHQRGPQGRDQRAARRREHRDAARAPRSRSAAR